MKVKLFFLSGLFFTVVGCGESGDPSVPDYYENGSWTPFSNEDTVPVVTDGATSSSSSSNNQSSSSGSSSGSTSSFRSGVFKPSSDFKDLCRAPRTSSSYDDAPGDLLDENNWLRSWSHETYLWYDEIPDQNPANFTDPIVYFNALKTPRVDADLNPIDNFHYAIDTEEWNSSSSSGVSVGYGVHWIETRSTLPFELTIAYVEPGSPADNAGWERGDRVIEVNDVEYASVPASLDELNSLLAGLYPTESDATHRIRIERPNGVERSSLVTATAVALSPVPKVETLDHNGDKVGYLLFSDHNLVSEQDLYDAFRQLAADNVEDLVLDLRYNGGGYLYIASQVAYMIAGGQTAGEVFLNNRYNDQYTDTDPWGDPVYPTPFFNVTSDEVTSVAEGTFLPSLQLSRVFVLTTGNTCSASEAIMNGLRGIDVDVIQVGTSTCGKPYGFLPQDNCGTTYLTIQFQGENAKGFGEYSYGFGPQNSPETGAVAIPGCYVEEDFGHELGDPDEALLEAALDYRSNQRCPSSLRIGASKSVQPKTERMLAPAWKQSMF